MIGTKKKEKCCEVFRCPFATQEGFCNANIARRKHSFREGIIVHHHFRIGARVCATKCKNALVWKRHGQRPDFNATCKAQGLANQKRQAIGMTGNRFIVKV